MEEAIAAQERFVHSAAWRRSKRGNLWRNYEGLTLTVFERDDGCFGWCIAGSEPQFSHGAYQSEEDAVVAIGEELEVSSWK